MHDRLITTQEAQIELGVLSKSSFWDIIAKNPKLTRVEYSPKCIRFVESEIKALREKYTVRGPLDRARLADGRRS